MLNFMLHTLRPASFARSLRIRPAQTLPYCRRI